MQVASGDRGVLAVMAGSSKQSRKAALSQDTYFSPSAYAELKATVDKLLADTSRQGRWSLVVACSSFACAFTATSIVTELGVTKWLVKHAKKHAMCYGAGVPGNHPSTRPPMHQDRISEMVVSRFWGHVTSDAMSTVVPAIRAHE